MPWYTDLTGIISYIQSYLNDNTGNMFTVTYLQEQVVKACVEIGNELGKCITRYSFDVTNGQPTYRLQDVTKDVLRVTINGFKMEPKTQSQLAMLSPVYRSFASRAFYYSIQMDGYLTIRFFPVPQSTQSIVDPNRLNGDDGIGNGYIVMCTQNLSGNNLGTTSGSNGSTISIPNYTGRKLIKDYVCWKAYAADGHGQDLRSAKYFKQKFKGRIDFYKDIINTVVLPTTRELEDVMMQKPYRLAQPILPPNFGPIVDY